MKQKNENFIKKLSKRVVGIDPVADVPTCQIDQLK